MDNTYKKEVFRAAIVNQDYRSHRSYALKHKLSPTTVGKVWNGNLDITLTKLIAVIEPLNLCLTDLFPPENGHNTQPE